MNALNTQIQVATGVSSKAPGSLGDSLFWYYNDQLIVQPSKFEDGKLIFTPTADFVNMLKEMK